MAMQYLTWGGVISGVGGIDLWGKETGEEGRIRSEVPRKGVKVTA